MATRAAQRDGWCSGCTAYTCPGVCAWGRMSAAANPTLSATRLAFTAPFLLNRCLSACYTQDHFRGVVWRGGPAADHGGRSVAGCGGGGGLQGGTGRVAARAGEAAAVGQSHAEQRGQCGAVIRAGGGGGGGRAGRPCGALGCARGPEEPGRAARVAGRAPPQPRRADALPRGDLWGTGCARQHPDPGEPGARTLEDP